MTTLITGAGLIGSLTATELAARGEIVVLADIRAPTGTLNDRITFETCDVTDAARVDQIIATHKVTQIVHTAAMLSTGIRQDPVRGITVNVVGTAILLEAARRHNLRRIVCASSSTVGYASFGRHDASPIEEDLKLATISQRPGNIYAMTKLADEHLALLYHDLYGVDAVLMRYAAVVGGDLARPTSVPSRLLAVLVEAGKRGTRIALDDPFLGWDGREEFVDARDCARANLAALDAKAPKQRVYNVAPGTWATMAEFAAAVRAIYPKLDVTLPAPTGKGFAGFPHMRPAPSDISAAKDELGFTCAYDLAAAIKHWAG